MSDSLLASASTEPARSAARVGCRPIEPVTPLRTTSAPYAAAAPGQVVPVDSEHSAIAQSLRGGRVEEVRRLVVTASGGPFRGRSRESLRDVTPADALAHPNFAMGRVVTTNSATLVNKGLEVIEAHLLFDIPFDRIEVVVHPQQVVHSMVEFVDGSTIAQAGPPRMLVPIALGLSWPERLADVDVPVDWTRAQTWEFEPLDDEAFPAVRLAREVGAAGGTHPAVYNAANEVAVDAFHDGRISFVDIVDTVDRVVHDHADAPDHAGPSTGCATSPGTAGINSGSLTVEDVMRADAWARDRAREVLGLATDRTSDAEGALHR
jgi:1-deoxy-D-xylulose-5-phosphate reductoisomerase